MAFRTADTRISIAYIIATALFQFQMTFRTAIAWVFSSIRTTNTFWLIAYRTAFAWEIFTF